MLRRVKSLNFSVSGESLPAEATKQKWRLKLRPAIVDDSEHASGQFFPHGEHRHYAHAAAVAQKGLDGFGAAEAYDVC